MEASKEARIFSSNERDEYTEASEPLIQEKDTDVDLEKQREPNQELVRETSESTASTTTTAMFLGLYFAMNLGLTFYNKAVLGSFAFPWILTAVHTGSAALGSYGLLLLGYFELSTLTRSEHMTLFMVSLLFTINVAMSNVSLEMVSVPFHQIMRATCPVFTIAIYRIGFSRRYAAAVYASLVPIVLGVGLATVGDYHFTPLGFTLTLTGVILAAIKTVVTNRLMTGRLRLPVLEVLLRMGPPAVVQSLLYSQLTGELGGFVAYVQEGHANKEQILGVAGNGALAFALNVTSFTTNKLAGAVSMTICANLKQCATIVLGAVLWAVPMRPVNGAGVVLALAGAAWYSSIGLRSSKRTQASGGSGNVSGGGGGGGGGKRSQQ